MDFDDGYDDDDYGSEYHIIPFHELDKHEMHEECKCEPIMLDGIWIHQQFKKPDAIAELTHPDNICLN